ncbi:MAG: hypothetical protein QM689_04455 [Oscillospiraceae bacterium]
MGFRSNAEEIRFFTKKLLEDGNAYSASEITRHVKSKSTHGGDFTVGMFAGALYDLVKNGSDYYQPGRGLYQLHESSRRTNSTDLSSSVKQALKNAKDAIYASCQINAINISSSDAGVVEIVKETLNVIERAIQKINDNY